MVYLTPKIKLICEEAPLNELQAVRSAYRHTLRGGDLKWLDRLLQVKQDAQEAIVKPATESGKVA